MGWRRCGRVARTAVCGTWSGDERGIRMATHPLSIVYFLVAAALGAIGQASTRRARRARRHAERMAGQSAGLGRSGLLRRGHGPLPRGVSEGRIDDGPLSALCQHLHLGCADRAPGVWNADQGREHRRHGASHRRHVPDGGMSMTGGDDLERDRRPTSARHLRVLESLTHAFIKRGVSPNSNSLFGLVLGVSAGLRFASTSLELVRALGLGRWWSLVLLRSRQTSSRDVAVKEEEEPDRPLWNEIPDALGCRHDREGRVCAPGETSCWVPSRREPRPWSPMSRVQAAVEGAPQDCTGPMAKPQRMALVLFTVSFQALAPEAWLSAVPLPRIGWPERGGSVVTFLRRIRRASAYLNEGSRERSHPRPSVRGGSRSL